MKTPVTLTIDAEKKCLFESMKEIHGMTISGFLDSAIDSFLNEISPLALLEIKIKQHEEQIAELAQMKLNANLIEHQLKVHRLRNPIKSEKDDRTQTYLQEMRIKKFNESINSITRLWEKGDMNWTRIVELYQFKNIAEAKEWFVNMMAEIKS